MQFFELVLIFVCLTSQKYYQMSDPLCIRKRVVKIAFYIFPPQKRKCFEPVCVFEVAAAPLYAAILTFEQMLTKDVERRFVHSLLLLASAFHSRNLVMD